jgi:hypothetical protein
MFAYIAGTGIVFLRFPIAPSTEEIAMRATAFKTSVILIVAVMTIANVLPAIAESMAAPAAASTSTVEAPQPTVRQIVDQQTNLRSQVLSKKAAFRDLTDIERDELIKKQNRILELLDSRDDVQQLRAEEQVELFNHLEWVSATLRKAEEDRQVCERSRTVGSNRFQTVCMTARQYREHKERARQSMRTAVKCQGAKTAGCINEAGGSLGGGVNKIAGLE